MLARAVCHVPALRPRPACLLEPQLPGWALMTLGCYALFNIGSALITFRDTPEAGEELKEEEAEARAFFSSPARGKLAFEVGAVPEGEGNGVLGMNE